MHLLAEYWDVVTDPAHILAEGTWEIVSIPILYGLAKALGVIKRVHAKYDREHGLGHSDG